MPTTTVYSGCGCCGGGGGGGGGGPTTTVTCCPYPVPQTLTATFSGGAGSCVCLNGLSITLTWDSSRSLWAGNLPAGTCGALPAPVELDLECTTFGWVAQTSGCIPGSYSPASASCSASALLLVFNVSGGFPCCSGGTAVLTITY